MNRKSFRRLTFVFAIGVIVGAITSFSLSTLGASSFMTEWVRESDVVLRKAPAQTRSSRRSTDNPRSQLNLNVSHLLVSKSTGLRQTAITRRNGNFLHMLTAGHANNLTASSTAFNQLRNDETLLKYKLISNYQTVTYRTGNKSLREQILRTDSQKFPKSGGTEAAVSLAATQNFVIRAKVNLRQDVPLRVTSPDGAGPTTKTPRTARPYTATLGINMRSNEAILAYSQNTDAPRQRLESLSQNRSVATTTTTYRTAAGFRVTAPSKPADLSLSTTDPQELLAQQFKPLMSTEERSVLMRSLQVLASLLEKASVTYFLYEGTLLGSFRHRGLIPWDDDLDIIANYSQEATLRKALANVPGYKLDLWSKSYYKFYAIDALPTPGKHWLWPFIDIFFFKETDSRIFDIKYNSTGKFSFLKKDVFPLVNRPFDGLWLPVPHNEEVVVRQRYDVTRCMSNTYSHKNEASIPGSRRYSVACRRLYAIYPFAFRNVSQSSTHEVVKVGDKIISEYNYV